MIGNILAHYRITDKLGEGGMGQVWLAEDEKLGRQVALKVLPEEFAQDPERMARFEREAKVLASLNHPNIATLFELETVESDPDPDAGATTFLVMELVEGEDLSERISRGPIPVDEATALALQIAEALEAAHEQGIVHRDLKPANIKLRPDGTVKVLDFGLAKAWETDHGDSSLSLSPTMTANGTAAGVILGTAAYMSPEQAAGKAADRRADIWSFGVVFWEMLTGHKLFEGETVSHVLAAVLKDEVDLDELPSETPRSLKRLIGRCLRKKRKRRLQAIGDARVVLEDTLAEPDSPDAPRADAVSAERRSLWPWIAAMGLVASIATAAVLTFISREPSRTVTQSSLLAPEGGTLRAGRGLALSPDGTTLAVVAEKDNVVQLWIREMDGLSARPLEGTENATHPFWSPDSRHLGFFADAKLKRIPVVGGDASNLAEAEEPRGGAWGSEDRIVFSPDYRDGLWSIPAAGGEARRLTELDSARGEKSHRWPTFLPDGRNILFLAQTDEGGASSDHSSIEVHSLEDGRRTRVLEVNSSMAYTTGGDLLFWRSGSLYAQPFDAERFTVEGEPMMVVDDVGYTQNERGVFTTSLDGKLVYLKGSGVGEPASLEWYDRRGRLLSEAAPPGIYRESSLAPDGTRLAYAEGLTVWIRDLIRGTTTRVTDDDEDHLNPVWSPDGEWLAFTTNRTSGSEIRRKLASGLGEEELVIELEQVAILRSWSPDGKYLAFEAIATETEWDFWLYSFEDHAIRPVVMSRFSDVAPSFSPDSRWIAYTSSESGRVEIYVVPVNDQSRKWRLSTDGGRFPIWSPAGGEVFYTDRTGRLTTVSVRSSNNGLEIGTPKFLFQLPEQPTPFGAFDYANFGVAPDGERFLLQHAEKKSQVFEALILVQNWDEIIRGRRQ